MRVWGALTVAIATASLALAACGGRGLTLVECMGQWTPDPMWPGQCPVENTHTVEYPDGRPGGYPACIVVDDSPVPPKGRARCAP